MPYEFYVDIYLDRIIGQLSNDYAQISYRFIEYTLN